MASAANYHQTFNPQFDLLRDDDILMKNKTRTKIPLDLVTGATQGLKNDAAIVAAALADDFHSTLHVARERNLHLLHRQIPLAIGALFGAKRLTLMFQIIPPFWYAASKHSVLIPNQEFLNRSMFSRLRRCKEVWCKTRYAEELLKKENFPVRYIGFTGTDILQPETPIDYSKFIHVAGRSHLKGTRQLLKLWQQHPEWPELIVVTQQQAYQALVAPNIHFVPGYLSSHDLHTLMNTCGVHLCVSETEGFGHYISEALSVRAVVVTTNAPPMNELVSESFAVLVDALQSKDMGLGSAFQAIDDDLEKKIEQILSLPLAKMAAMGTRAREHFLRNALEFRSRITTSAHNALDLSRNN